MPWANEQVCLQESCPALTDVERRFVRSWLGESPTARIATAEKWSLRRLQLESFEVACWPVRWPGGGTLLISDPAHAWLCDVLVAEPWACATWAAQLSDA